MVMVEYKVSEFEQNKLSKGIPKLNMQFSNDIPKNLYIHNFSILFKRFIRTSKIMTCV